MKKPLLTLITVTSLAAGAMAAPLTFDFKDPKGVNNAVFKLDAPLEAINGSASGVSGKIRFDPANPAATTGRIVVDAKTLMVPNNMMKDHLHGEMWLNTAKHGEIAFEAKSMKNVRTSGIDTTADVTGTFTLKGVSKDITVPVKLTYLKDKLGMRVPNQKGDLLVIRSKFMIKRSEFGINPGQNEDKVSDEIELTLSIAGAAPQS